MTGLWNGWGRGCSMGDRIDHIARAICREQCAFYGEPPCWLVDQVWPNPTCEEPGCHALAKAAVEADAMPGALTNG